MKRSIRKPHKYVDSLQKAINNKKIAKCENFDFYNRVIFNESLSDNLINIANCYSEVLSTV